jgi:hypothetical protein
MNTKIRYLSMYLKVITLEQYQEEYSVLNGVGYGAASISIIS